MRRLNNNDPGETSVRLAAQAGSFRSYRLSDSSLVELKTFRQTYHYDFFYRKLGISDRLWVVFPVSPESECYDCFDKFGRRRFSRRDLALASSVMRGIKWFHRQVLLSHGLGIAESRLTPNDRRVMQALVGGATEKSWPSSWGLPQALRINTRSRCTGSSACTARPSSSPSGSIAVLEKETAA